MWLATGPSVEAQGTWLLTETLGTWHTAFVGSLRLLKPTAGLQIWVLLSKVEGKHKREKFKHRKVEAEHVGPQLLLAELGTHTAPIS